MRLQTSVYHSWHAQALKTQSGAVTVGASPTHVRQSGFIIVSTALENQFRLHGKLISSSSRFFRSHRRHSVWSHARHYAMWKYIMWSPFRRTFQIEYISYVHLALAIYSCGQQILRSMYVVLHQIPTVIKDWASNSDSISAHSTIAFTRNCFSKYHGFKLCECRAILLSIVWVPHGFAEHNNEINAPIIIVMLPPSPPFMYKTFSPVRLLSIYSIVIVIFFNVVSMRFVSMEWLNNSSARQMFNKVDRIKFQT